jgi:hypothetical protein
MTQRAVIDGRFRSANTSEASIDDQVGLYKRFVAREDWDPVRVYSGDRAICSATAGGQTIEP